MRPRATLLFLACAPLGLGCPDDEAPVSALEPELALTEVVDFGEIPLGTERVLPLDFANTGDGVLRIERIEPDDDAVTAAYRFEVEAEGFEVLPGAQRSVPVRFLPLAPQEQFEQSGLTVISNLGDPIRVELRGRGVGSRLEVEPSPVDFGAVLWGSQRELEVRVYNRHDVPAGLFVPLDDQGQPRIQTIDGAGEFELLSVADSARSGALHPAGNPLSPGAYFTARLRYTATPEENRRVDQGRWWLSTCTPAVCATAVPLRAQPRPDAFECAPSPVDFGRAEPDERLVVTATCTNVVSEPVDLVEARLETGPEGFELVDPPSTRRLVPGESFTVEVAFSPPQTAVGNRLERAVTLQHRKSADFGAMRVTRLPLAGTVGRPRIEVEPRTLLFSPTAVGTRTWRRLRIRNTGQGALTISSLNASGPFTPELEAVTVPPLSARDLEVTFEPLTEGQKEGQLEILSSDAQVPRLVVPLVGEARLLPPCRASIAPSAIELGAVQIGRTARGRVSVTNDGGGDCLLNDVAVVGTSTAGFEVLDDRRTGRVLAAGTSTAITVGLTPGAARGYVADLELSLSTPGAERVRVPVTGLGVQDGLVFSPPRVDVGPSHAGCQGPSSPLWVLNPSNASITITAVDLDAAGYTLEGLPEPFPANGIRLDPTGELRLQVGLQAGAGGPELARLRVDVQGQGTPYYVPVRRLEDPDGRRTVRFEQSRRLDVLFVVDDGTTFSEEQANLPSAARQIVDRLEGAGLDYRLGVLRSVVFDPTCPVPPTAARPAGALQGACGYLADGGATVGVQPDWRVIEPATLPAPQSALSGLLVQTLQPVFRQPEVLEAARLALSPPISEGWNAGLRREGAALAVVYVTEQDDRGAGFSAEAFGRFLAAEAGDATKVTVSGAAGPPVGNCFSAGLLGRASPRLTEAAARGGGLALEICDAAWPAELAAGGLPVLGLRRRFGLPTAPVPGSVRVFVDGRALSAGGGGWALVGDHVELAPTVAAGVGQRVQIDYRPSCGG